MDIQGKTALVTGASSGIGAETARQLAQAGAKVVLAARRLDRLHGLQQELTSQGLQALAVQTDITCRHQVKEAVKRAEEHFAPVDILVNNAGLMHLSYMRNLHVEEWERMIDVNIKGVLYGVEAVLSGMRERRFGHIINISSTAGRSVFAGGGVYCGTKFAVNAITEALRMEIAPAEGVRFTLVEPGIVSTELPNQITDQDVLNTPPPFHNLVPLQPIDIAKSVLYALSQPEHVNVAEVLVMPTNQPS